MWVTIIKRSMKQALIIRSSKSSAKHSCLADLGVIWEKCGMEKRVVIMEIGVLPSTQALFIVNTLRRRDFRDIFRRRKIEKTKKRDIEKLEPFIDKFIIMDKTDRKNCAIPLWIYEHLQFSLLQYFCFILYHQLACLLRRVIAFGKSIVQLI